MSTETDENNKLPILPLKDQNIIIFPGQYYELIVGRDFSIEAINYAQSNNLNIVVAFQKDTEIEKPVAKDFYPICTISGIEKIESLSSENEKKMFKVIILGINRARLVSVGQGNYYHGTISNLIDNTTTIDNKVKDNSRFLRDIILESFPKITINNKKSPDTVEELSLFLDSISNQLEISSKVKISLLKESNLKKRMDSVIKIITGLSKHKELPLTSKPDVKSIKNVDVISDEINRINKTIEESNMPESVKKIGQQEIRRLKMMIPSSSEFQVTFNYVEVLSSLPWSTSTNDILEIEKVKESLNNDHFGLEKVKECILEFLAVKKLTTSKKGSILCFVGPPGVGKTSISKSIAESMGRKFARMSLGGVHDEAEIRGHRRTYVGAMPGRIIQEIKKIGFNNPVFTLDEVDKLTRDFRGDPSSALLEVLDPEQNNSFVDNYLGVPFDLSNVFFILTANSTSSIPPALKDRMEIIELPGYSPFDKLKIAQSYLIPKQKDEKGLCKYDFSILDCAINRIIGEYTNEAGVRSLERLCGKVMRKIAVLITSNKTFPKVIDSDIIAEYLGPPKIFSDKAINNMSVGISTGLSWSQNGGSILFIESILVPGKGKVKLTGNTGKVLQESADAAHTWIMANSEKFNIDKNKISDFDIHIHLPAGAIPKDGPSAGLAIISSILSVFINKPVDNSIAMTGEISIRGRVLPIGGLREKILGAHRAGIRKVIYPTENKFDIEDVPEDIINDMEFIPVSDVSEALTIIIK